MHDFVWLVVLLEPLPCCGVHDYETPAFLRYRQRTDTALLAIAVGTVPILLLEFVRSDLAYADRVFIDIVNIAVLVLFALDYLIELTLAQRKLSYVRHEWASLLIVVSQGVALVPGLAGAGSVKAVRGARAIRSGIGLARALAIGGAAARGGRDVLRKHAAGFAFGVAGLTWITSAVTFTLVEDVGVNRRYKSFFDALWWSSATITTVGTSDVSPVTTIGRITAVITGVVGVSTFAIVTAKIAEYLVRTDRRSPGGTGGPAE